MVLPGGGVADPRYGCMHIPVVFCFNEKPPVCTNFALPSSQSDVSIINLFCPFGVAGRTHFPDCMCFKVCSSV